MAKTKKRVKKKPVVSESESNSSSDQPIPTPPTTTICKVCSDNSTEDMTEISSCCSATTAIPGLDPNPTLIKVYSALKIIGNTKGSITKKSVEIITDALNTTIPFIQTNDHFITEIKNLTASLNDAQDVIAATKVQRESQKNNAQPPKHTQTIPRTIYTSNLKTTSYAQVAKRATAPKIPLRPPTQFITTVLASQDNALDTVIDNIKKTIMENPQNISVTKINTISKGKVVIHSLSGKSKNALDQLLKDNNYNITELKKLDPPVILKGIPNEIDGKELIDIITKSNPDTFTDSNPKLLYFKPNRNRKLYNAVIRVTPRARNTIFNTFSNKLSLGIRVVHVEDANPTVQCTNCFRFGHTKRICNNTGNPNEQTACWHCSDNHFSANCPNKESPNICINCRSKSLPHAHPPTHPSCPIYNHHHQIALSKINYG